MKQSAVIFLLGLICGVWQWLVVPPRSAASENTSTHPWPQTFEGKALVPLPVTTTEKAFAKGFPGAIGNFRCGEQQVILRYVTRATRQLHPAADCLRASGHHVEHARIYTDADGHQWSGCYASKAGRRFFLRERIVQIDDHSLAWTDVSSWYWHAQTAPHTAPWLAFTVISKP